MDPNAALRTLRSTVSAYLSAREGIARDEDKGGPFRVDPADIAHAQRCADEMADAVESLDSWLSCGGFAPDAWAGPDDAGDPVPYFGGPGADDDDPDADADELVSQCPACGSPIDYCQGHGDLGDPAGAAVLAAHDDDEHSGCHPDGCEDAHDREDDPAYYCAAHDIFRPCPYCVGDRDHWDAERELAAAYAAPACDVHPDRPHATASLACELYAAELLTE